MYGDDADDDDAADDDHIDDTTPSRDLICQNTHADHSTLPATHPHHGVLECDIQHGVKNFLNYLLLRRRS